jgi:hypothetical protein
MKNQKKTLSLLFLLAANQSFNINAGIGDFFDDIGNTISEKIDKAGETIGGIVDEVGAIGVAIDSMIIEATDKLDKKFNWNTTAARQHFSRLLYGSADPNAMDEAIRKLSLSGFLDEERDVIKEIIHIISLCGKNIDMMSTAQQAEEAMRIAELVPKIQKIGAKMRRRMHPTKDFKQLSPDELKKVQIYLQTGQLQDVNNGAQNNDYNNSDTNQDASTMDTAIAFGILFLVLGVTAIIAYIVMKCAGGENEWEATGDAQAIFEFTARPMVREAAAKPIGIFQEGGFFV